MLISQAAYIVADELENIGNIARIDVSNDYELKAISIKIDWRVYGKPELYRNKKVLSMTELDQIYPEGEILIRRTVREMLTDFKVKSST